MNQQKHSLWLVLTRLIALTLLYVLGGLIGRETAVFTGGYFLVWPPAGIALAGILLYGYGYWPAITIGSVIFSWLSGVPFGPFMAATAVGNAVGAVICAFLLRRSIKFDNAFSRSLDAGAYLVLACGLGTTVNALFNAVGELYSKTIVWDALFQQTVDWWVPNALATLVVAPVILVWLTPSPMKPSLWRWLEGILCAAGLVAGTLLAFDTWFVYGLQEYPLAYLPYPFLLWAALRFGPRGAATGTLAVAALAIYSLQAGRGPFYTSSEPNSLGLIGSYIAIIAISDLLLAAASLERRRATANIVASEKRLRLVVSDQQDLLCRFLPDGRLTFVNPAYCQFHSRTEAELLGTNFFDQFAAAEAAALKEKLAHLPAERPVTVFDRHVTAFDGHPEWHQYNIRRQSREGLPLVEFQAGIQNISARKAMELELQEAKAKVEKINVELKLTASEARRAAERANEANTAKSEFLANMSHELRTPLGGMLGMIELLGQTKLDARQREFMEAANESANALLHVINNVLDYSKIEAGKLVLAREEFSLRNLVDGVLENAAVREPAKKISLVAIVHHDIPHQVTGDPNRLRQVLLNLVANGVKFTPKGEVVVRAFPLTKSASELHLRVEVTDTGIGLTRDEIERLFEPFMQADTSSSRKFGGTGLGLAISRKLIEIMAGAIGVQSSPGSGSTFWFELPLTIPPQPAIERNYPGLVFAQVLIASPNPHLRESLQERLQGWGIDCRKIDTLEALIRALKHELQSTVLPVILCDDEMLAQGGAQLRRRVAESRGSIKWLLLAGPAATLTGEEDDLILFQHVLLNPIREQPLYEALVAAVKGHPNEDLKPLRVPGDTRDTQMFRREVAAAKQTPISRLRILAAEDHPFNRRLCEMMLDTFGAKAEWAVNGREAVEKFQPDAFDAILMDCNMPEMDGHEATAAIRHIEMERQAERAVRIIAITANALPGERERCLAAGMDDYISKPFNSQQLYQALLAAAPAKPPSGGFDAEKLEQLVQELNRAAVTEMLEDFLGELPDRLREIYRLHQAEAWPDLRRAAHSLKGLFSVFGFQSLSEQFLAIEEAALRENAQRVTVSLVGLNAQADNASRQLKNWLRD